MFEHVFTQKKPIIGMLHIFEGEIDPQIERILRDLKILESHVNGVIIENYDCGYLSTNIATDEMVEILFGITEAIVRVARVPVGINVLPNDYENAFRIADEAGARFVQMDHVTGKFKGCTPVNPRSLLQIRLHYPEVVLLGGIHPKYYELIDPGIPIGESAMIARKLCDAIVVTGKATGEAVSFQDLVAAKLAVGNHPVLIGSGFNAKNARGQIFTADGAIVGTAFKPRGVQPDEPVVEGLVIEVVEEVEKVRKLSVCQK